jgi:hypothetical protein
MMRKTTLLLTALMLACIATNAQSKHAELENSKDFELITKHQFFTYTALVQLEAGSQVLHGGATKKTALKKATVEQKLLLDSLIDFSWNTTKNDWVNYRIDTYTYDANQNKISFMEQTWSATQNIWVNTSKDTCTYDTNGNKISSLSQVWDTTKNNWVNNYKYTYTCNANGSETNYLLQTWDTTKYNWVNNSKDTSTYNANGYNTSNLYQSWSAKNNWVINSKDTSIYDANGNKTSYSFQTWSAPKKDWVNSYNYTITYNASGNKTSFLHQQWDAYKKDWVNFHKAIYYYSESNTGVKDLTRSSLHIYPNPVASVLYTSNISEGAVATICNLSGQMLISTPVANNQIDVSNLKTGIYTITITGKAGTLNGKFVKK